MTTPSPQTAQRPEILAPAGDRDAFLAALAAGADAIYCGLKHFSARMAAENFSIAELAALAELARSEGRRTYIALNTLLKPGDLDAAGRLLDRLNRHVRPEAIIVQDLGLIALSRQTGFTGEIHLSTLANVGFGRALAFVGRHLPVSRVVLPRELSIDEIRSMSEVCPANMDLEVFVHGALCYAVSGRCYWSSYLGGKSGLRGRCVQPCRRVYTGQRNKDRLFSCMDLGLDVLAKTLLDLPRVRAWKIEGRKKGAHYVYYTVSAYRLLRDAPNDPKAKKAAQDLLEQSLGRKTTHYFFLPQRPQLPVQPGEQTGSGLFVGTVKCGKTGCAVRPRVELLPGDLLRIGYEDLPGHAIFKVRSYVAKGRSLSVGRLPETGPSMPVFLIDRAEPEMMRRLQALKQRLSELPSVEPGPSKFTPVLPVRTGHGHKSVTMHVYRHPPSGKTLSHLGIWLVPEATRKYGRPLVRTVWWWLPPVVWPDEEAKWTRLMEESCERGARRFVCNAPWQMALVPDRAKAEVWAGPFCNLANPLALQALKDMGFSGAMVSPELAAADFLALPEHSPLPLGLVIKGGWPLCLARSVAEGVRTGAVLKSPKGEGHWVQPYGPNFWLYPDRPIDLTDRQAVLQKAGYVVFVDLHEPRPKELHQLARTSSFNWDLQLL